MAKSKSNWVSFAEIKERVSLEDILARYGLMGTLTKKGDNLVGKCPLCERSRAQSFSVSLKGKGWQCFACQKHGNIFDLVMFKEGSANVRESALLIQEWFPTKQKSAGSGVIADNDNGSLC